MTCASRPLAARLLIGVLGLLAAGCTRAPSPPNIIVVLVDTLRADRLGSYGDARGLTPYLDHLSARGVRFANAYATSSWTMPSVASLFTSLYPIQHHVTTFEAKLPEGEVTLAEVLAERGYESAGFTANLHVTRPLGYAQGFGDWQILLPEKPNAAKARGDVLRVASQRWLEQRPQREVQPPLLLFYQFMEPHAPYEPQEPFRSRFVRPHPPGADARANLKLVQGDVWGLPAEETALLASLYDGEVACADEELHRLLTDLEQRHVLDNAIVVIVADHGEELGERGAIGHGFTLYNEQLRVPLIILAPGIAPGTVEEPVSLIDLAPTLLDLVGVKPPASFEGRSLVPFLRHSAAAPARTPVDVIAELEPGGQAMDLRTHNATLVRGPLKVLRSTNMDLPAQIFDLTSDPGERTPNPSALGGQVQPLLDALFYSQIILAKRHQRTPEQVPLDDATREKLRALGYRSE